MNERLIGAVFLLMLGAAPLSAGGSPPPGALAPQTAEDIDFADPARIARGKESFEASCASFCHGQEPPLFIGRKGLEPDYVFATITEGGRGATPMPPWGGVFTPDEIWDLVAYIKYMGTLKPLPMKTDGAPAQQADGRK
ncbi:c-type cytochrome [Methylocella silvestris]|uniref:Cytochrome c domain-containing protein n=1 Tax=Methylocella silvestris TaxID=199596 RepID=A0A2J7TLX0_METSI|nr:cytochrome c [Methylocella silvestris]PNG27771.1 hypothetical protein CR492_02385 [Methylocella silvestris]